MDKRKVLTHMCLVWKDVTGKPDSIVIVCVCHLMGFLGFDLIDM